MFKLEEPDISLIQPLLDKLGPGGIPCGGIVEFGLDSPDPEEPSVEALVARAYSMGKYFNQVETGTVVTTLLVYDTVASSGLTPYRLDFLGDYELADISVKGVAGNGNIVGSGTTLCRFTTRCGQTVYIPAHAYHMPAADIRLESPQSIIRALGGVGHARIDGFNIEWTLQDGRIIDIPIDPHTNLPLIHDFVCNEDEKKDFGAQFMNNMSEEHIAPVALNVEDRENHEQHCAVECCQCVADETNQNLSSAQKELLRWHQKLNINMADLQQLMKPQKVKDQAGNLISTRPPIIPIKYKSTANLKPSKFPFCLACKLATPF